MPSGEASTFAEGASFWIVNEGRTRHLWFILSDPVEDDEHVIYVNFTSFDASRSTRLVWNDPACVLERCDYPQYIRHPTCVCYGDAKIASICCLESKRDSWPPKLELHGTVPAAALTKARVGATRSMHIPQECLDILDAQQLL